MFSKNYSAAGKFFSIFDNLVPFLKQKLLFNTLLSVRIALCTTKANKQITNGWNFQYKQNELKYF